MKRLHVVSDRHPCNGMFAAASLMVMREAGDRVVTCTEFLTADSADCADYDEVVVHGCWLPCYWKCCWRVLRLRKGTGTRRGSAKGPTLARMTHANLDPVRLAYRGWKKWLVSPIERWLFRKCDKILVTCEAEREWVREYIGAGNGRQGAQENKIQVVDLKRFFNLGGENRCRCRKDGAPLHVMYLGRRHPLKGVAYLQRAVEALRAEGFALELRIVSNHQGEELAQDWAWCDVLCLPTLSENFGLVVAEALERGVRVITTDGAPAWSAPRPRLVYLQGFRNGSDAMRVKLLADALRKS